MAARLLGIRLPLQNRQQEDETTDILYDVDSPPIGIPQRPSWDSHVLLDASRAAGMQEPVWLPVIGDTRLRKGMVYIIGAFPKVGKTELMARAVAQWPNEHVHYFTEEAAETWGSRFMAMEDAGEAVPVMRLTHALVAADEGSIDSAALILRMLKETTAFSVVIIDTVRELLHPEDENDNAKVSACIRPYVIAARRRGITLIFLHHTTKRGGKGGRGISGATAFLGVVDGYLEILDGYAQEDTGPASNERTIRGRVRLGEVTTTYYHRTDDGITPDPTAVPGAAAPRHSKSEQIYAWLLASPGWWSEASIAATTGIARRTVHDALVQLVSVEETVAARRAGRTMLYLAAEEETTDG